MGIEYFLTEVMNEAGKGKASAPTGDLARYYAILLTDIEKAYAFYMLYLYPHEADIPPAEEIQ